MTFNPKISLCISQQRMICVNFENNSNQRKTVAEKHVCCLIKKNELGCLCCSFSNPNQMYSCSHFPELAAPSPSFSAVVMGRNIAVVEKKLCWSDALFYCRDFYWDLLSIRSEEEQREVEEVLKTASFPLTKHVWLGLRRYAGLITRPISPKVDVPPVFGVYF